jgi:pSer/pThr/pTyr-binding forkhead associated (FHA) protein
MVNICKLIIQSGTGTGTEFPLEKNELFLGRDLTSDLVINDPEVSRRHLRLVLDGATYRLEDLGSTNGTFINGQRLTAPVVLKPGEVITLGEKIVLRYEVISTDPNATVVVQRVVSSNTQPKETPVVPPVQVQAPVAPPPSVPAPVVVAPPARPTPSISAVPAYQQPVAQVPLPGGAPKKNSKALVIILILVGILVLFCVVPWIIIDLTNSYCNLFPGILNMFITNACAV